MALFDFTTMTHARKTWLIVNPASGSNDDEAFEALCACCRDNGIEIDRVIRFPDDDLPTAGQLDDAGIEMVTIFTGDGTINAAVTGLYGWSGTILILPGGTMNLLSIRLHGDVPRDDIVARVARGEGWRTRPAVARCSAGDALAGLMIGPGTAWFDVREAMRDGDVLALASGVVEAIGESTAGTPVRFVEPRIGKDEGYPLVVMTPERGKISVAAYHSETVADYAQQGVALLKRDFRQGPHDDLGALSDMELESAGDEPLAVLIDGEPATLALRDRFAVAECGVDLVMTCTPDDASTDDASDAGREDD